MVKPEFVHEFAASLTAVTQSPHFEKPSYRIKNKIFMTHNLKENRVCVRLSEVDQNVFSTTNKDAIQPVPNKWGKYGWTLVSLKHVKKTVLKDIVTCAYCQVAPVELAVLYQPKE
jgi:predicted DNA-binding protein (MmcQ/YjbR family)